MSVKKAMDKKPDKAAARKPREHKQTKGESLTEISELLGKIEAAEDAVQVAEIELDARKEEAKTAKGVWMTRVAELRNLVRTRKRWAQEALSQPLLNQKPKGEKEGEVEPIAADVTAEVASVDWLRHGIGAAGFTDKQCEALQIAGLQTLGDLQSKMNQHGVFWAKEVGINGRYKTAIEDVFNRYLMDHAA